MRWLDRRWLSTLQMLLVLPLFCFCFSLLNSLVTFLPLASPFWTWTSVLNTGTSALFPDLHLQQGEEFHYSKVNMCTAKLQHACICFDSNAPLNKLHKPKQMDIYVAIKAWKYASNKWHAMPSNLRFKALMQFELTWLCILSLELYLSLSGKLMTWNDQVTLLTWFELH